MSDLISRSELKISLDKKFSFGLENKLRLFSAIDEQLTAYDIDKVVDELEKATQYIKINEKPTSVKAIHPEQAIEIVKQGGVSDVCEWKSASDGEFIQNPHTKRLYSNEPSMKNIYCNTCGKKIKIVGD